MRHAIFLATVLAVCLTSAYGQERPADFGRQWMRSHPLPMMGLTILDETVPTFGKPFDFEQYKSQNYTILLAWKPRVGLFRDASEYDFPWMLHVYAWDGPTDEVKTKLTDILSQYPGCVGLMVNDEPSLHGRGDREGSINTFENTGRTVAWMKSQWPDLLVLSNLGGAGGDGKHYFGVPRNPTPELEKQSESYGFGQYVRDYVTIVKPDVLMFDSYIFKYGEGNKSGVSPYWYESLWIIRKEAQQANIPYWAWMSTWDRPSESGYNVRLPSESDYRMNVFSALTCGFKGFADFTYCGGHERDILMPDGTPSPLFEPAAKAHAEVVRIGQCLRYLTSTEIAFLAGDSTSRKPTFIEDWQPGLDGDTRLHSIDVIDGSKYEKGLIGCFRDDRGQRYFMLTNLYQHADKSADECAVKFRLKFDPSVRSLLRLNRETGQEERLTIDPAQGLLVSLPGGTGDLFKYDEGPFVGVE